MLSDDAIVMPARRFRIHAARAEHDSRTVMKRDAEESICFRVVSQQKAIDGGANKVYFHELTFGGIIGPEVGFYLEAFASWPSIPSRPAARLR